MYMYSIVYSMYFIVLSNIVTDTYMYIYSIVLSIAITCKKRITANSITLYSFKKLTSELNLYKKHLESLKHSNFHTAPPKFDKVYSY